MRHESETWRCKSVHEGLKTVALVDIVKAGASTLNSVLGFARFGAWATGAEGVKATVF